MGYILSIDQGTTGTTAALIDDQKFELVAKFNQEFPQIFPRPGWVEHNLENIWESVKFCTQSVLDNNIINPKQISSIGITNQRETICAFTKDGRPLANAIVWQDRRTSNDCNQMRNEEKKIKKITGLPLDPYFSATKIKWLLENNDHIKKAYQNNNLYFGTIDTFLLFKLTGNMSFATEASNASRTLLMNLETGNWDQELLKLFGVDKNCLPEIKDSFTNFGQTKGLDFLPDHISITGILGDQQAALFGQAGLHQGDIKCTYGTGAFILLNTGKQIKRSQNGLLSTVAFQKDGELTYALEGSCYIAGAAVQWLRDHCSFFEKSEDIEKLAASVSNLEEMKNILFLPFFTGLGSPHWKPEATGAILGLTRDTNQSHLSRACLEGIALSINDLIHAMKTDTKLELNELKVDGGAVSNNLLMSMQASLSNLEMIRPDIIETTAYGAALASGVGASKISFEEIPKLWKKDCSFLPEQSMIDYFSFKNKQWQKAISKLY